MEDNKKGRILNGNGTKIGSKSKNSSKMEKNTKTEKDTKTEGREVEDQSSVFTKIVNAEQLTTPTCNYPLSGRNALVSLAILYIFHVVFLFILVNNCSACSFECNRCFDKWCFCYECCCYVFVVASKCQNTLSCWLYRYEANCQYYSVHISDLYIVCFTTHCL